MQNIENNQLFTICTLTSVHARISHTHSRICAQISRRIPRLNLRFHPENRGHRWNLASGLSERGSRISLIFHHVHFIHLIHCHCSTPRSFVSVSHSLLELVVIWVSVSQPIQCISRRAQPAIRVSGAWAQCDRIPRAVKQCHWGLDRVFPCPIPPAPGSHVGSWPGYRTSSGIVPKSKIEMSFDLES